jgi:hypothetical protein
MTTRRRRKDPPTRLARGRGRGGEQAATRSRDPSAPAVRKLVANLGFEFMICRSKNVLYNSVNAFFQLGMSWLQDEEEGYGTTSAQQDQMGGA